MRFIKKREKIAYCTEKLIQFSPTFVHSKEQNTIIFYAELFLYQICLKKNYCCLLDINEINGGNFHSVSFFFFKSTIIQIVIKFSVFNSSLHKFIY